VGATVLEMAQRYLAAGLSVIPVLADGSKAAAIKWKEYMDRHPTQDEIHKWFKPGSQYGVAVVCGAISGNLAVIDFETNMAWERWMMRTAQTGSAALFHGFPIVKTPKGGRHLYCRISDGWVAGCKLAMAGKSQTLIEIRAQGHYVIAPGSPIACHELNRPYEFEQEGWLSNGA
jgi:hypothetical protein